jgi:hypothetical protein
LDEGQFWAKVGAFHLSKSFDFDTCALNLETKKAGWVKSMKISCWDLKNIYVWPHSHREETFHDYIEVLSGFWEALHEEHKNGYGSKRSRGQWILYQTVELSMWVWCEAVEGPMDII